VYLAEAFDWTICCPACIPIVDANVHVRAGLGHSERKSRAGEGVATPIDAKKRIDLFCQL
jgi:hypothetical protein